MKGLNKGLYCARKRVYIGNCRLCDDYLWCQGIVAVDMGYVLKGLIVEPDYGEEPELTDDQRRMLAGIDLVEWYFKRKYNRR